MKSCQEISRLISDSMDRKLPMRHRFELKLHLFMCRNCARLNSQMHFLRHVARKYAKFRQQPDQQEEWLSLEARERIKKAMK